METDVLVIGGGTAGTMAAIKAKQTNSAATVLILEKANIRRSGAIAMVIRKRLFSRIASALDATFSPLVSY